MYFEFDDVEKLVNLLKDKHVEFVHELKEQPWKQKVVRFYDPDNNIIEVGESLEYLVCRLKEEGHSIEQISELTGMSVTMVNELIEKK